MDYKTYTKCREVCSTWNKLLTSKTYQAKEKSVFREDILKLEDNLFHASRKGKAERVLKLIRNGALDVNSCGSGIYGGKTPLYVAAMYGHSSVVRVLMEKGADLDKASYIGATPLNAAAHQGHLDVVHFLLKGGATTLCCCI